jgi:hypothetical protein
MTAGISAALVGHVHEQSPETVTHPAALSSTGWGFRQTPAHVFARDVRSMANKICSDGQGNAPCQSLLSSEPVFIGAA